MSYSMLSMAYGQGIRKVVTTSHSSAFDECPELVGTAFQKLNELIKEKLPKVQLYRGCEVYCRKNGMENILEKLWTGIYPFMNQTKYVLIEFSTRIEPEDVLFCTIALRNENRYVVASGDTGTVYLPCTGRDMFRRTIKWKV